MKDTEFRNNLRWIAASGAITRYPKKSISNELKTIIYMVGMLACGFVLGFLVGMNV